MSSRLSPKDQELYRTVDEVLHYRWDPIGISDVPQARDEYHGYLPQVFGLLRSGASPEVIATFLGSVATGRMGLSPRPEHDLEVASILVTWRENINAKFA
ncbi:MAG: hypothetical protein J0I77_04435 [Rudaea sp.]|uniref:hypothetical protein n=1 Tax=unclassified Rudaea TaxID=2627037 RepID=UPI0010F5B4AB|nr:MULTISPECIES: hypothetical protein [unclassified Rudaea]MBN8884941.1 hypothetical protein [Rudaea sp.]MBR0344482.1 hypothetical protein [Rudaea sp.]